VFVTGFSLMTTANSLSSPYLIASISTN